MSRLTQWLGSLINSLGLPGFVRDTDYRSAQFGTQVRVRRGSLFTVICVNGLDLYFHRLSGHIDGVGFSPSTDCIPAAVRESAPADASGADREPR